MLAVIAGLLDLIPQIGATIASIILVAVALTVSTEAAVIMLVLQLIYQQVENYIIYPIVYRQAVELSPFTTIVAVLIAGSILGVVGAILAVPFAAVIKIVTAPHPARRDSRREVGRRRGRGGGVPDRRGRGQPSPLIPSPISFAPITRHRTAMIAALLAAIHVFRSSSGRVARSPSAK